MVSSKLYDSGLTFTVLTSRFLLIFREAFLVGQQRWASLASLHCHRKYRPESGANRSFNESSAFTEQVVLRPLLSFWIQLYLKSHTLGLTGAVTRHLFVVVVVFTIKHRELKPYNTWSMKSPLTGVSRGGSLPLGDQ